jgi:hypothetical protein
MSKPDLAVVPPEALAYIARGLTLGKHARTKHLAVLPPSEAALRVRDYLSATLRHLYAVAANLESGYGPNLQDVESGLPHLAHAISRLAAAISIGANAGILPTLDGEHLGESVQ